MPLQVSTGGECTPCIIRVHARWPFMVLGFGSKGFRRYLVNTSWLAGEKLVRFAAGLSVGIWIARYLGPDRFGLLSYAMSFVGLFAAMATLGLDGILVRELVMAGDKRDALLGTSFFLRLAGSFLALILLAAALVLVSVGSYEYLLIIIAGISLLFQSVGIINLYFQSRVISRYSFFSTLSSVLISSAIKVWLILSSAPLMAFAFMIAMDAAILAAAYIYFYVANGLDPLRWRFEWSIASALLRDSWPLILSGLVISIYMKIDQVMIKSMMGNKAVGIYAAAVNISEAGYFIPVIISNSVFPAIVEAKAGNEPLYRQRLQRLYDLMTFLAVGLAAVVTIIGSPLVALLYGSAYLPAAKVLMVHIWASVFVFWGVANSKWFLAENLQVFSMVGAVTGAFLNIILNYPLINRFGVLGAAFSTVISYAVSAYLCLSLFPCTRKAFILLSNTLNPARIFRLLLPRGGK